MHHANYGQNRARVAAELLHRPEQQEQVAFLEEEEAAEHHHGGGGMDVGEIAGVTATLLSTLGGVGTLLAVLITFARR